jgi:hypothetical protein
MHNQLSPNLLAANEHISRVLFVLALKNVASLPLCGENTLFCCKKGAMLPLALATPACWILWGCTLANLEVECVLALPAGIADSGNGFVGINDSPFFFVHSPIVAVQAHVIIVVFDNN